MLSRGAHPDALHGNGRSHRQPELELVSLTARVTRRPGSPFSDSRG